jgi:ABC-type ATPase involved in cell division
MTRPSVPQSELRPLRRDMQIIFQDPYSSPEPAHDRRDIVGEAMRCTGSRRAPTRRKRVVRAPQARSACGPHAAATRTSSRAGSASASASPARWPVEPELIVCDEPVSALDVSIQAQVVNLLMDLQEELGLAYLFIAHDLSVVEHISRPRGVMYLGRIVEQAPVEKLYLCTRHPLHPYPDRAAPLEGDVPCRSPDPIRGALARSPAERRRSPDPARGRRPERPLTLPDVVRLAKELGSALDAAHDAGVLHRDVKPENVFLAPFGAKIGDFGIARVPDASVTRTGMGVVGTPAYAAPEVLRGKDPSPSPKADQFLARRDRLRGPHGRACLPGRRSHQRGRADRPEHPRRGHPTRSPREAAKQATAVLRRGMAKDPAARFGSCTELADALEAALGSSAIAPTVPSARREARPGRSLSVLLGLVIVVGLAAIVLTRATGPKTPGPPASAEPTTKPQPKPKPHAVKPPPKPQEPKGADATPPPQAPASEPDGGLESP